MSVNKAILIGNLGGDPESHSLPSGTSVCNVSLATSERWKDKQTGEQREQTEWHNLVAFGRTGEVMVQYLQKGSKVYIEGKIQTRSWEDRQTGDKRYKTEIVVDKMQMLDSKSSEPAAPRAPAKKAAPAQQAPADDFIDDDLPFS